MAEIVVTRGAQITLTKDVREKLGIRVGDTVIVNALGGLAIIAKRDPKIWRTLGGFLPPDFEATLKKMRADSTERLRRLGIA
jgi:bifunctional DNA-binding transcriptional regulator/antitoxin component of YhaV-PrlF toxin-antitoxin module